LARTGGCEECGVPPLAKEDDESEPVPQTDTDDDDDEEVDLLPATKSGIAGTPECDDGDGGGGPAGKVTQGLTLRELKHGKRQEKKSEQVRSPPRASVVVVAASPNVEDITVNQVCSLLVWCLNGASQLSTRNRVKSIRS
jgi:hypothetical protein